MKPPFSAFEKLVYVKLGGSLITDKKRPRTARLEVIQRLGDEIAEASRLQPQLKLVLGHGSGSFAHVPARQYGTRQGVRSEAEWFGFTEVWREAQALDRLVVDALAQAGLPVVAISPLSSILASDGKLLHWDVSPIRHALQAGLLPIIYGDVVFDIIRGGTIFSTEDLFSYLADQIPPQRILLAGIEDGVWQDFPTCTKMLPEITRTSFPQVEAALGRSSATDVTGGMASKVLLSLDLVQTHPNLEVLIFSGEEPGVLIQALCGASPGTRIFCP